MGKSKRPKRLTSKQKQFLSAKGMDATKYLLLFDTDQIMILVDKKTGEHMDIMKEQGA